MAELIKDFVRSYPKDKLDFKNLTKLVLEQYPNAAWKKNSDQWRYHTTHNNGNYHEYFTKQERETLKEMFSSEKYVKLQEIDCHRRKFCDSLIKKALDYERLFGKKLNVTGEIGEILVCHRLGLKMVMDSSSTFDAVDNDDKRVQIKTRRSQSDDSPIPKDSSTISKVSHSFDYLLLAILDRNYRLHEVWKTSHSRMKGLIEKQGRNTGPTISSIKLLGEHIPIR